MTYTFRGQFSGAITPAFIEPLAGITVRFYKHRGTEYVSSLATIDPKETMTVLVQDAIAAKASALLAETKTDEAGKFVLNLHEQTGYRGEALDIDLWLTNVPGRKSQTPSPPVQVALTTMKPRWQQTDDKYNAEWEYCLPAEFWRDIRARFDAWVICGRVIALKTQQPVSDIRVHAFDADWIQDDDLGESVTDSEGKFRIDYERADFTRTPLSPLINYEPGGPDLYFKLDRRDGSVMLDEAKTPGQAPGRANEGHCFFIEFNLAGAAR